MRYAINIYNEGRGGHRGLLKYHENVGCRISIWLSIYGAVVLFVSSVNAYVCRYEEI